MQGSPQTSTAPTAPSYPSDALADLAVSILGALEGNNFDIATALSTAPSSTRGVRAACGCCLVEHIPRAPLPDDMPFYFGKDSAGYVLVTPRIQLEGWPKSRSRRLAPMRLTRWLTQAPPGSVVRHTCDQPSCIRASHLICSTQAENVADSLRRGRRNSSKGRGQSEPLPRRTSTGIPAPTSWTLTAAQQAQETRFCVTGFASPSKAARRAKRTQLQGGVADRNKILRSAIGSTSTQR